MGIAASSWLSTYPANKRRSASVSSIELSRVLCFAREIGIAIYATVIPAVQWAQWFLSKTLSASSKLESPALRTRSAQRPVLSRMSSAMSTGSLQCITTTKANLKQFQYEYNVLTDMKKGFNIYIFLGLELLV